jgi:hypothetical protein
MGRKSLLRPTASLDVHIDAELRTRLDLLLWSEAEGRVPKGAYQRIFNTLLTQLLDHKTLDLAPFLGTLPGEATVRGHPMTLERLVETLEGKKGVNHGM